jgi:hypothetical protein
MPRWVIAASRKERGYARRGMGGIILRKVSWRKERGPVALLIDAIDVE